MHVAAALAAGMRSANTAAVRLSGFGIGAPDIGYDT